MLKELWKSAKSQFSYIRGNLKHPYFDRFKYKDISRRWSLAKFINNSNWFTDVIQQNWGRSLEGEPLKPISSYTWPLYTNPVYNRELTKFMFSFKDELSTNRNINNLMFITGPEKSGKSWFLAQNIEKFKNATVPNVLFHINLNQVSCLNFEAFLDIFEGTIIASLIEKSEEKFKEQVFLTPQLIIDALLHNHDKLYLSVQLENLIEKSIQNDDFLFISQAQKEKLKLLISTFIIHPEKKTQFVDNLPEIINILSENMPDKSSHKRLVNAALTLCKAFYMQEEISTCPEKYFSGLYRTGIKTTWFLFDILNLIGGYHELSLKDMEYPHVLVVLGKN